MTFNNIAARFLDYGDADVATNIKSVLALAHPDDEKRLIDEMEAHLAGTNSSFEADVRMRCKRGGYVWTNMRGRVTECDSRDLPVRVTGMLIDISRRKELEAAVSPASCWSEWSRSRPRMVREFQRVSAWWITVVRKRLSNWSTVPTA